MFVLFNPNLLLQKMQSVWKMVRSLGEAVMIILSWLSSFNFPGIILHNFSKVFDVNIVQEWICAVSRSLYDIRKLEVIPFEA